MKHVPDTDFLREWLEETEGGPPDPVAGTREAMSHLDETRQASRWWPFPVFYGKARTTARPPTTTDTDEFQPSPIPASNGQTPTVIGRTTSMLSPAKAITAGAVIFAIAGAFLIAQPFERQSSMPGAATDGEHAAPVEFTGLWFFDGAERLTPTEVDGDPGTGRDGAWFQTATGVTDPRFNGQVTIFDNADWYSGGNAVYGDAWRVENADGAWQSDPAYSVDFADGSNSGLTAVFHGEDAYAGLVAVVDMELVRMEQGDSQYWNLNGVIFDGGLPPQPDARPLP